MTIKKVLHIAGNMDLGGSETLLININRNIDGEKLRFDYAVETSENGFYARDIKALNGGIYPFILRRAPFASYWFNIFNLISVIKNHGPYEALHVHYTYGNWFFLAVARLCGIKKRVSHVHTTKPLDCGCFSLRNILRSRLILFFATDLFACSYQAGIDLYGKNAKFTVINNSIDCARFAYNPAVRAQTRQAMGLNDKFVICNISRLEIYKNHTFLLDVFAEVYKKNKNAVLMLVGGGSIEEELKAKALNLGIKDAVLFLGPRKDSEVLLQAADCFVFPSLFEGFGIAALEAQAVGLPCLLSCGVPKEAAVINCRALPLELGPQLWAEEVLTYTNFNRQDQSAAVSAAGFDIKETAKNLEKFYLK